MMSHRNSTAAVLILILLFASLLASCTGNGSSGNQPLGGVSLSPLIVADRVSVVDPQGGNGKPAGKAASQSTTGVKALLLGLVNMNVNPLPSTSDYMRDVTMTYVNERSTEAFQGINEILCSIKQTRYDTMVNQGPYLALVDHKLCSNDASNSTDQASDSGMPEYGLWWVKSSRQSETAPHIVDVWLFDKYQDAERPNGQFIVAQMTINEGADTAPPYGKFQVNWYTVDPVTIKELNRGLLLSLPNMQTGEALLQYAEETPNFSSIRKATLQKNTDGSGGGTVYTVEGFPPVAERFDIAFSPTHFLRQNYDADPLFPPPGSQVCLSRENFEDSAWRYGLYNQSGMRVNVNSGFSIRKDGQYGWVGYWGLWLPDDVTVGNGDTVYKHDFTDNSEVPYTVFQSGGKLKRHSKKTLTLQDIQKVPIYWGDGSTQYAIVWDNTTQRFWKAATQVFDAGSNNWYWVPFTPAAPDPAALVDLTQLYSTEINGWSQALGGQVRIPLNMATNCTYSATNGFTNCGSFYLPLVDRLNTPVVFYAENIVYPGEVIPAAFDCYDNCPQADTASGITNADSITWANTWDQASGRSIPYSYSFNPAQMLLSDGTGPVIITAAGSSNQWGLGTGALIDPATPNLDVLLDCNWDLDYDAATNPQICGWKAWSVLDEFYTWETGPNNWNMFTGLQDGTGNFVRFDPPIQVQYVHHAPASNPTPADLQYDGVTFNLEYSGFGNLSGIPGACVDMDNGSIRPCGPNTRWVPEFTIPNDDAAGNLTEVTGPGSEQYIVKALEKEQRMQGLLPTDCTDPAPAGQGLDTGSGYPLPSMTLWKVPTSGPLPNITSAPRVIGGVVQ